MRDVPVTIMLLTYEDGARQTAERTLRAVERHLTYDGPLHLHIADDGSVPGHVERIANGAERGFWANITATDAQRGGYGRSYNLATQAIHAAHSGVVLPLEDDWELTGALDLGPLGDTLMEQSVGVECIRLGYLGFTQMLRGEFIHTPGGVMARLDFDCPEPHIFAGHPRLETVAFERHVGPWPEGMRAGDTEFEVAHRLQARSGVAWPLDLGPASMRDDSLFRHIGEHGLGGVQPDGG